MRIGVANRGKWTGLRSRGGSLHAPPFAARKKDPLRFSSITAFRQRASSATTLLDAKRNAENKGYRFEAYLVALEREAKVSDQVRPVAAEYIESLKAWRDLASEAATDGGHSVFLRREHFVDQFMNLMGLGAMQRPAANFVEGDFAQVSFNLTTLNEKTDHVTANKVIDFLLQTLKQQFPQGVRDQLGFVTRRGGDIFLTHLQEGQTERVLADKGIQTAIANTQAKVQSYIGRLADAEVDGEKAGTLRKTQFQLGLDYHYAFKAAIPKPLVEAIRTHRGRYYEALEEWITTIFNGKLPGGEVLEGLHFEQFQQEVTPTQNTPPKRIPDLSQNNKQIRLAHDIKFVGKLISNLERDLETFLDPGYGTNLITLSDRIKAIKFCDNITRNNLDLLSTRGMRDPRDSSVWKRRFVPLAIAARRNEPVLFGGDELVIPVSGKETFSLFFIDLDHMWSYFKANPPDRSDKNYWAMLQIFIDAANGLREGRADPYTISPADYIAACRELFSSQFPEPFPIYGKVERDGQKARVPFYVPKSSPRTSKPGEYAAEREGNAEDYQPFFDRIGFSGFGVTEIPYALAKDEGALHKLITEMDHRLTRNKNESGRGIVETTSHSSFV